MTAKLQIRRRQRFGHLVTVREMPRLNGMRQWLMKCDCGVLLCTLQKNFASSGTKRDCGTCELSAVNGRSSIPEYKHWRNMMARCDYPNHFQWHAGRGVSVCRRWRKSFKSFLDDVGFRPSPKHTLDRWPDKNGGYKPGNVRWATQKEQCRNMRNNHLVVLGGAEMTLVEAIDRCGLDIKYNTVLYRLKRGWPTARALGTPTQ